MSFDDVLLKGIAPLVTLVLGWLANKYWPFYSANHVRRQQLQEDDIRFQREMQERGIKVAEKTVEVMTELKALLAQMQFSFQASTGILADIGRGNSQKLDVLGDCLNDMSQDISRIYAVLRQEQPSEAAPKRKREPRSAVRILDVEPPS